MTIRIAINGFGRIGRMVVRAANKNQNIEIVAINDLVPSENLAYLLKYDSTHGRFDGDVQAGQDCLVVDGKTIECFSETMFIDLTIDGADEIDANLNMIKGGGAALLREKIVASASREQIIIVSGSKLVQQLGAFPLPVEVIPFGWQVVFNQLESLQGNPELRLKQGQPSVTDQGNFIIDCHFRKIENPEQLEQHLNMIPGVVENGLFINLCTRMIMADGENIIIKNRHLN